MFLRTLLILLPLCLPSFAHAERITLLDANNQSIVRFDLPQSPEVVDSQDGQYFTTYGSADTYGTVFAGFGSTDYNLQFFLAGDFGYDFFTGPQLYTGGEGVPMLIEGSFTLNSFEGLPYTLTIDNGVAVTPEPASVLLCATGGCLLLCTVFSAHRRRNGASSLCPSPVDLLLG